MNRKDMIAFVGDKTPAAALLEQLAEEASELTHAALKYARIIRGDNPTPMPLEIAYCHLQEEMADVILVARVLMAQGYEFDNATIGDEKLKRWISRIRQEEAKNGTDNIQIRHENGTSA